MKRYEYHLEYLPIDVKLAFNPGQEENRKQLKHLLDELGKVGWRLCGVDGYCYYFAKEVE